MRLKTRLVLATSFFTVLLTAALGSIFFSELLRGRMAQAQASNDVLAHELLLSMRGALLNPAAPPPTVGGERGFEEFVSSALQHDTALRQTMDAIVSYSLTVQDVSVSGANGRVLVSTDPALLIARPPSRLNFNALAQGSLPQQWAIMFGKPKVLDVVLPLERNGGPFLYAHIGVRSSLLRAALLPWLREATFVIAVALLCSLVAAVLLSSVALRPIERISRQLEALRGRDAVLPNAAETVDTETRVSSTIAEIDRRIQVSEKQATNLSNMLHTLKDGMLLVEADGTVSMMSDAVRHFLPAPIAVGTSVFQLFAPELDVESMLREALEDRRSLRGIVVQLMPERDVELSLDFANVGNGAAMLTLHDAAAREQIEREVEVSRRMASIGRLTAGVGHEVKNPIHAMVLHLELLRGKLNASNTADAARHVDVLATEMTRLDRVVQVLADFTRPMEPVLLDMPVQGVVQSVLQLVSVEAAERGVRILLTDDSNGANAHIDRELVHQALLNVVLNALDAMSVPGTHTQHTLTVRISRDRGSVVIGVRDTGTGIAPDMLERIFHLYFTTKSEGSGIGLAMSWRIVQMMGGTITVESSNRSGARDRGTLFTVKFPLAARPASNPANATAAGASVRV